jgi:putative FmdB family regulatory protein
MPKTNYKCSQCGEKFEYSKGIFERETKIKCPKCGAQNVKKTVNPFSPDSCSNSLSNRGGG